MSVPKDGLKDRRLERPPRVSRRNTATSVAQTLVRSRTRSHALTLAQPPGGPVSYSPQRQIRTVFHGNIGAAPARGGHGMARILQVNVRACNMCVAPGIGPGAHSVHWLHFFLFINLQRPHARTHVRALTHTRVHLHKLSLPLKSRRTLLARY